MSDNFYDDFQINKKKNLKEVKFSLIDSVESGDCCIYCCSIGSKCTLHNGTKKFNVPKPALDTIRNPSKILGEKIIEENNLQFGGKRLHFNTCIFNYAHDSCKNCVEGRFKEIIYKGKKLRFCYPLLKENTNVIPIGFHWTFNMTCKGNEILDFEIFPYDKNSLQFEDNTIDIKNEEINKIKYNDDNFPIMNNEESKTSKSNSKDTVWSDVSKVKQLINENEIRSDTSHNIEKKDKEIEILLKENKAQREAINGLKATINLDGNVSTFEYQEEISKLKEQINQNEKNYKKKINSLNNEIDVYNRNMKELNHKIYDLENFGKISDKDFKNIKDGVKHFSNILFESFVISYNNSDF